MTVMAVLAMGIRYFIVAMSCRALGISLYMAGLELWSNTPGGIFFN